MGDSGRGMGTVPSCPPCQAAPTRSPTCHFFSEGPRATTSPITSWPGMRGLQVRLVKVPESFVCAGKMLQCVHRSSLHHGVGMADASC